MKCFLLSLTFSFFCFSSIYAQTGEDSIKAVINNMFAAMKNG